MGASQDSDRPSNTHFKDLVAGRDERITALECEIERLKASINEQSCELTPRPEIDTLDLEQLRRKYETLERQFEAIWRGGDAQNTRSLHNLSGGFQEYGH